MDFNRSEKDRLKKTVRKNKQNFRNSLKLKLTSQLKSTMLKKEEKNLTILNEEKKIQEQNFLECHKDRITDKQFQEFFTIGKKIGEGCHSVVYQCYKKDSTQKLAVKITKKKDLEHFHDIRQAYKILKMLKDDNIIRGDYLFINQQILTCHLVSQYCDYPDLAVYLAQKKKLQEEQVAEILEGLLKTVSYMHNRKVCHRDIKPANILYNPKTKSIKIIDFELARISKYSDEVLEMWTKTGTPSYRAPEMFKGGYDEKVDVWALGVLGYELLTGKKPFASPYEDTKIKKILNEQPQYKGLSFWATNLLKKMLEKDPKKRVNATEALTSPFFLTHQHYPQIICPLSAKTMSCVENHHLFQQVQVQKKEHKKSYDTESTQQYQQPMEQDIGVIKFRKLI